MKNRLKMSEDIDMSKIITDDCFKSFINNHVGKTDISHIGGGQ